jgi:hypothetical protein
MNISDTIIGALIGAAITAVGWFIDFLKRRRDASEKQQEIIAQVFSACNTRAVYGLTHAQTNLPSMFHALIVTRTSLQKLGAFIRDQRQQQFVMDVIRDLDTIERLELSSNKPETLDNIDNAKRRILGLLKSLSDASGIHYTIPSNLIETNFLTMQEAISPPP